MGSNDKALWHRVYERQQFSGWKNLGGILTSDPSHSLWNYGRFDVFVRGTDNRCDINGIGMVGVIGRV